MGMDLTAPAGPRGKFDPSIGTEVSPGRGAISSGGLPGGDFKCALVILSGLKEVPNH